MIATISSRRIKKSQKLRIIRYFGKERISVFCTYGNLDKTVDMATCGAVNEALTCIFQEPCRGISARFNNMDLQVDLL